MAARRFKKDGTEWIPWAEFKKQKRSVRVSKPNVKRVRLGRKPSGSDKAKKNDQKQRRQLGTVGVDPRNPVNVGLLQPMVAQTQNFSVQVTPQLITLALWGACVPAAAAAYAKGWSNHVAKLGKPQIPYQAYVFMVKTLSEAVLNGTPTVTTAPNWFRILYDAVKPRNEKYRAGGIQYRFKGDNAFGITPLWYVSNGLAFFTFGMVDQTGLSVNGYPVLQVPPVYVPADGAGAFADMVSMFGEGDMSEAHPMWRLHPLSEPVSTSDSSAFAGNYPEMGEANGVSGYLASTYHEVKINRPLLSKFSDWQGPVKRGWDKSMITAGGPYYGIGRLMECETEYKLRNKLRPNFKKIDFNEVFEVLALWLGRAMELFSANDTVRLDIRNGLRCPLTMQDTMILLRQAIISANQNQVLGGDIITPAGVVGVNPNFFVPFQVGAGIGPSDIASQMLLPLALVENLRCLGRRSVAVNKMMIDWIPVWGVYNQDILAENYLWSDYTASGSPVPVFPTVIDEIAIRIEDGGFGNNPANPIYSGLPDIWQGFVAFNGRHLQDNVQKWNKFVTLLSANTMPLVPIGAEAGINYLEVISMSYNYKFKFDTDPEFLPSVINSPQGRARARAKGKGDMKPSLAVDTVKLKRQNSKEQVKAIGMKVDPIEEVTTVVPSTPSWYEAVYVDVALSNQKFSTTSWEEIQQYWVLPSNRSFGPESDLNYVTAYQTAVYETNAEPISTIVSDTGSVDDGDAASLVTAYQRHDTLAQLMTRPVMGMPNSLETNLTEAMKQGRGGFLGDLIGKFAGQLGGMLPI